MSTHFTTQSDSHYEIRDAPQGHQEIRRVNHTAEKRADGAWVRLYSHSVLVEGYPVILEMANLGKYGPDDEGNRHGGSTTRRTTTPITTVWEDNA